MCTCAIDSITNPDSKENRLRRECNRALKERNDARDALKVASAQRTLALALVTVLTIVFAFAL